MIFEHYLELVQFYRRILVRVWIGIVGGVVLFSVLFLFLSPLYTAKAKATLLPTEAELAFTQSFVRGSSANSSNMLSQTAIEYLLSYETSRETVDRLIEEFGGVSKAQETGLRGVVRKAFAGIRRTIRKTYNILNSGKNVPREPYDDLVLTMQDAIDVEMVEGTFILEISVTWDNPEVAAAAANTLADVYVARAQSEANATSRALEQQLMKQVTGNTSANSEIEQQIVALRLARASNINNIRVIESASVPIYPSFPKVVVYTIFAIVGATVVSVIIVVTLDTFSNTLRTRSDLQRFMDGRTLPTVSLGKDGTPILTDAARERTRRVLRLRGGAMFADGATMSMSDDSLCDAAAKIIEEAFFPNGRDPGASQGVAGQGYGTTPSTDVRRGGLLRFGGGTEAYVGGDTASQNWLVITMRPGEISGADLVAVLDRLEKIGVQQVFGLIVQGRADAA